MDSQRQSCQAPKCCVENSDLVTAAGDGDLEKVRALSERIAKQIFQYLATPARNQLLEILFVSYYSSGLFYG